MRGKKKEFLHQPAAVIGKVVLEFFNNDDENFKVRSMNQLVKEIKKEHNVSCLTVEEGLLENPERGILVYSLVGVTKEQARNQQAKVLAHLDEHAPARIALEESEVLELS